MPRIDEMPEYTARLPKSTHDLSHTFGFTATVAHLLPVFHDFVQPGDRYRVGFNWNLRTQPLQSAAMEELDVHTEYFFVPMNLLFEPFGSIVYQLNDYYSSNFSELQQGRQSSDFPVFLFNEFSGQGEGSLWSLRSQRPYTSYGVAVGESLGQMAYRLLDHLGYNPNIMSDSDSANWNPNTFPYPFLAYHCIYQYYYRLDSRELFDQRTFNIDSEFGELQFTLDPTKFFTLHYRPFGNDYFTDIKVSPIVDSLNLTKDMQSFPLAYNWLSRNGFLGDSVLTNGTVGNESDISSPSSSRAADLTRSIATQFGFKTHYGSDQPPYNGFDINTANIRAMFANEKLWSVTGLSLIHI